MTTFYICRHGETENNKNQRFSGWIDTPLTEAGVKDALSAASKLASANIEKIVSSDLGRAFITAYLITRRLNNEIEIERAKELREVNYGDLANRPYSAYPKLSASENTNYVCPNGESLAQMQQRVMAYIHKLASENPGKTILLVAHDGTINAVKASFSAQEMGVIDLSHNAHDFVGKFELDGDTITSFREVTA